MTSKGNQQRNSLDCNSSKHKIRVSDSVDQFPERGETVKAYTGRVVDNGVIPDANKQSSPSMNKTKCVGDEKKSKQRSRKFQIKEKLLFNNMHGHAQSVPDGNYPAGHIGNMSSTDPSELRRNPSELKDMKCGLDCMRNGLPEENTREGVGHSDTVADRSFGASALSILKLVSGWLGEKKPLFSNLTTIIFSACDYVRIKTKQAYPIVWRCLLSIVNIMLLISVVWLDCTVRGLDSFLRMGTASFFSVIWCNIFSVIAMAGFSKFLVVMAVAALAGIFVGFTLAILVIAISATVLLWLYGSFWTTALVIFVGGLAFALKHERLALLITTLYSLYCAKTYVGWLGLFLGLNISFISSDVLIYFLKHNFDEHGRSNIPQEEMNGTQDQPHYNGEPHTSFSETARSTDHSPGVTSTSGAETELTSEDEVVRLLNCTDHYSALGLSRYENVDVSLLKREYRKKAMLVHPDKNMGNEKAAEAFKKLQNAYEILLDTLKRKAYDDELRREDLLNYFRRFQSASQKNGRHGFFATGYAHSDADGEDSIADSRRIACKKCSNFHIWILTKKSKSQARWCQDCKDFHQARDGDGWIEQSSQPFFFGILQKVEPPSAYVCAESRIYDATEWFICQGMRCPANSHKPSFHVNTSVISKYGNTKGAGPVPRGGIPPSMEENMTEEEFFEWLQNAVQAGIFDSAGGSSSTESPSTRAANGSKSSSTSKRKKRGKKQW